MSRQEFLWWKKIVDKLTISVLDCRFQFILIYFWGIWFMLSRKVSKVIFRKRNFFGLTCDHNNFVLNYFSCHIWRNVKIFINLRIVYKAQIWVLLSKFASNSIYCITGHPLTFFKEICNYFCPITSVWKYYRNLMILRKFPQSAKSSLSNSKLVSSLRYATLFCICL